MDVQLKHHKNEQVPQTAAPNCTICALRFHYISFNKAHKEGFQCRPLMPNEKK